MWQPVSWVFAAGLCLALLCSAGNSLASQPNPNNGGAGGTKDAFFAAARSGDVKAVVEMVNAGTSVLSRDSKGNTALIIAAGRGNTEIITTLLGFGAQVEDATSIGLFEGKSALCWAASQGRAEAVKLLLQSGANPHKPSEKGVFLGNTALQWAASQGRTEVVRLLVLSGVDVDFAERSAGNFKGKTALMWASSQGRVESARILLESGSNVNAVDIDGVSALMWASGSEAVSDESNGHRKGLFEKADGGLPELLRLLLEYGALPDQRDKDGITAIMYACFHGYDKAVEVLLNAGADASLHNAAGKTALQLALSAGYQEPAEVIKRGPTIMSLKLEDLVKVSACGWLLSVLRAPFGTGVSSAQSDASLTIEGSCADLRRHGLDHTLGDLLYLARESSQEQVIAHLGQLTFASKVRATAQLRDMYALRYNSSSDATLLREANVEL